MARTVMAALFSSVDGRMDNPGLYQFDTFDEGMAEAMDRALSTIDDVILGATSYREWSQYWPTASDEFGQFINPVRKHVVSSSLTEADMTWQNSTLVQGDLLDFVRSLKEGEGRDISVCGSLSVARQLMEAGLLDQLTLMVMPVVGGAGQRMFADSEPFPLELVEHSTTAKGNALLTYRKR